MTVHVVSIGATVLESLRAPGRGRVPGLDSDLADAIQDQSLGRILGDPGGSGPAAAESAAEELRALLSPDTEPFHRLEHLTAEVAPGRWPASISAEINTLVRAPGGRRELAGDDVAVLLATDTVSGLASALWNALALTGGDPARVTFLRDPGSPPAASRGRALIVRIPGLDARSDRDFTRAMQALGTLGRGLVDKVASSDDEEFLFHLSGGYKAAVPYLIGLAEGLRSLPRKGAVQAYMLHLDTQGDAIRLPLRRMRPELVEYVLEGFRRTGRVARPPNPDVLEGYAYERTDRGDYALTAFGDGLLALYGRPEENTGS